MENINALLDRYKGDPVASEIVRALGALALTPSIRSFLDKSDPMALGQADRALAVQVTTPPLYTYKRAAQDALGCQDGCNSSGIARSMVQAIDAIREHGNKTGNGGTRSINQHPIVYLFLYKLMALNGHEPLSDWEACEGAEKACKGIIAAEEIVDLMVQGGVLEPEVKA